MIYCVWYPSGGFGHFVNAVLTLHGYNFVRPNVSNYQFSKKGNSHNLQLVAPKYLQNPKHYNFDFCKIDHYSVLVDNGINDESIEFLKFFVNSTVIKICYCDYTWPIIARTMIEKAMDKQMSEEITLDNRWTCNDSWAIREKYFLFLRDHKLRHAWRADNNYHYLDISSMLSYDQFKNCLQIIGIKTNDFQQLWTEWHCANYEYLDPVAVAQQVINDVKNNLESDISHIENIWTQSIIYYYIWLEFDFEVPHNDYSNWFTNTKEITIMLNKHGVND
jgi:hypothetical protein